MQTQSLDRVMVLNITLVLEAFLLLVATLWSQFAELRLLFLFNITKQNILIGVGAGLAMSLVSFSFIWLDTLTKGSFKWLSSLKQVAYNELAPIFTNLNWLDIVLIAFASGFCEEVFFRGVVQAQLGIYLTSLLFGFFHCPSLRHISYGLWAMLAGLVLGFLLMFTHSLWPPILAHSFNNLISLLYLRYRVRPEKAG